MCCHGKESADEKEERINSLEKQHEIDSINLEYDRDAIRDSIYRNSTTLSVLYHKLKKSVLMVMVKGEQGVGQGTAFPIDHHGTCITNYHVLARASQIELLDENHNKHHIERVIHSDGDLDFVIFKIDHAEGMEPLFISDKNAEVGEDCFAIGNPQGLESTLSTGIISGYRSGETFIQTSSEIAHGSSGGPLFNRSGEVIGITTMAVGESGNLNFAINIKKLKGFLPSLDRNVTLLSPKSSLGNTQLPPTVRDFLLAEEDHDLDAIMKCFSPEFYRF